MANNQNQPREFDAVHGGETPPPAGGAVLGGLEGVKQRLASSVFETRVAALSEALNYGEIGLDLVIKALRDDSLTVRRSVCKFLLDKNKTQFHEALYTYCFWLERINETIDEAYIYYPFQQFYNYEVESYDPKIGIKNPDGKAYVIDDESFTDLFHEDLNSKIEALIIRGYDDEPRISSQSVFKSLKAIFFGPYDVDYHISWTCVTNVSLILKAYPKLEFLQVRGGDGYYIYQVKRSRSYEANRYWDDFISLRHKSLKVLIVETGGLRREKIKQILSLELPALEHLELWLGSEEYGGDSSINDLMQIFSGQLFQNLKYLGLRNSEYSDNIANAIINSPIINQLQVLDLSMGTLGDEGAEALLNCPAVDKLTLLNLSNNCLTEEMVERLKQLNVEVIAEVQKHPEERYCAVAE